MVFRDASSKHAGDLYGPMGPTDFLAPWIDRSCHLSPLAAPARPVWRTRRPADLLGGQRRCVRHPRAVVTLACYHQFQAMRAFLLASATAASFGGLRAS